MDHHLAQLNVARFKRPLDEPSMAGFVAALDPLNAIADAAPGFVWRLQTEEGNATSIHAFEDDLMLVNMSVWESVEVLADYVYGPDHVAVMRRRREWAERMVEAYLCLWWIPAGSVPTVDEAKDRLEHLRKHGPAPFSFTFKRRFTSGEAVVASPEDWFCPA
ncbi:MAG: hypothetical protein QOH76_2554 [Thermoleophilaceae bacterium]|nr:hypothetical protein [Thermoleophilaceae bacterium]